MRHYSLYLIFCPCRFVSSVRTCLLPFHPLHDSVCHARERKSDGSSSSFLTIALSHRILRLTLVSSICCETAVRSELSLTFSFSPSRANAAEGIIWCSDWKGHSCIFVIWQRREKYWHRHSSICTKGRCKKSL